MNNLPLHELLICRSILTDDTMKLFVKALKSPQDQSLQFDFAASLIEKAETLSLQGNILRGYLLYLLVHDGNLAAKVAEKSGGHIGLRLHQLFQHDMEILAPLFTNQPSAFLPTTLLDNYLPTKKVNSEAMLSLEAAFSGEWSSSAAADALLSYYCHYGYGEIATHRAFCWDDDKKIVAIKHFDSIRLTDIIGYEKQKKIITDNTLAFLADKPANNALLVGARGTGKSSTVKALANEFYNHGLRLVQITKPQLCDLSLIMKELREYKAKKFIIFLDDLSFEDFEVEYKYLKSSIEGGVESRPQNILLYATSNRRHLIKETWRDREDGQDELYRNDSVNETISLSDRFGLVINYRSPNQDEYLAIIDHYLKRAGISLEPEPLRIEGHRWELEHSGRSGRTARQFVDHYLGHNT